MDIGKVRNLAGGSRVLEGRGIVKYFRWNARWRTASKLEIGIFVAFSWEFRQQDFRV